MFEEYAGFAKKISEHSGRILLAAFRSDKTVISYKSKTDLVTDADKASEAYLFKQISKKFPSHAIVAEEGSRKEASGDFIWYVDPLDGTNNFAHGLPMFCISIGIFSLEQKRVVGGVVYNPFLKEMFTAVRGGGAFLNGKRVRVSAAKDIGVSMLATGFPYDRAVSENNNLKEFSRIVPRIQGIRRMGSAAIDLSYVACGRLDGYWEGKLNPWDQAAGSLIVEEARGVVTKYDGSEFDPSYPEIVASNGNIHSDLIALLGFE